MKILNDHNGHVDGKVKLTYSDIRYIVRLMDYFGYGSNSEGVRIYSDEREKGWSEEELRHKFMFLRDNLKRK